MINILFIAFEFPPLSLGGVHRPLAFVKNLPQYGINPVVITLDSSSYKDTYETYGFDESLGKEIPASTTIIPVKTSVRKTAGRLENFISIYFSIHGNEVKYWKENFFKTIKGIIEEHKPEAIFATVPPFSVLPLVSKVARQYKLPLILDFRDAWSQWRTVPYGTVFHYFRTLSFERKYLSIADANIVTSRQTMEDFKRLHKNISPNKFHYIPNGYNGALQEWKPIDSGKETFTIGYVGSFYYSPQARVQMLMPWWKKRGHRMLQYIPHKQDWLYRSPYFFFKALQQFNKSYPEIGKKIKVKFAGKKPSWLQEMIQEFDLGNQVELIGEVSHRESLLFQQQCDALLITSAKQEKGKDYSIAGKTFEYLQIQRPIIAFVCEGEQKDLLTESKAALICDPDHTDGSVKNLVDLFTGALTLKPAHDFIKTLSRETQSKQLAETIKKII